MWGNASTDSSYQNNFNVGFSTTRSDVLIHLAQWQYWWWFWFAFLWCFYYLVILRTVKHRILKMKPKIVTSYRPHGKWGDFLACIVPSIWCINILTNSNLIMRLIEWQNESSLFTIRIRGRQWYWIYKFELKSITDILTAPKNIGNNKWTFSTFGDLQTTSDYLHTLQIRSQSKWLKDYWKTDLIRDIKQENNHIVSSVEQLKINNNNTYSLSYFSNNTECLNIDNDLSNDLNLDFKINSELDSSALFTNLRNLKNKNLEIYPTVFKNLDPLNINIPSFNKNLINFLNFSNNSSKNYLSADNVESTLWAKRGLGINIPFRLIKNKTDLINSTYNNSSNYEELDLFSTKFGSGVNNIESKPTPHTNYFTFKQQRMKKKKIAPITKTFKTLESDTLTTVRYSGKQILSNNKFIVTNDMDSNLQYKFFTKNRLRSEKSPITLSRRLLRTRKVLVIPAHVNITAITNSYDVVHSWFIPGLGLKLDCVPGRSTHHTFFVDNVGFYYGQCAEICGRYHHHMPIRMCALPFEHFLVWWQSFGMSKLLFTTSQKKFNTTYSFRKFVW